jgi:hypothetical protein
MSIQHNLIRLGVNSKIVCFLNLGLQPHICLSCRCSTGERKKKLGGGGAAHWSLVAARPERAAAAGRRRRRRGVNPLRPCLFFASWIAGGGGYCTSLGHPPVPASLVAWCVGPLLVVHRRRTCDEPTVRPFTSCGLYFSGSLLSDDLTYTAFESLDGWRSVILSKFQSSSSFQTAIVLSSFFSGGC